MEVPSNKPDTVCGQLFANFKQLSTDNCLKFANNCLQLANDSTMIPGLPRGEGLATSQSATPVCRRIFQPLMVFSDTPISWEMSRLV